jgi:hypothetical protein
LSHFLNRYCIEYSNAEIVQFVAPVCRNFYRTVKEKLNFADVEFSSPDPVLQKIQNQNSYPINDDENAIIVVKYFVRKWKFNHRPNAQSLVKTKTLSQFGRGLKVLEFDGKSIKIFSSTDAHLDGLSKLFNICKNSLVSLNIQFDNKSHIKEVVKVLTTFEHLENLSVEFWFYFDLSQTLMLGQLIRK